MSVRVRIPATIVAQGKLDFGRGARNKHYQWSSLDAGEDLTSSSLFLHPANAGALARGRRPSNAQSWDTLRRRSQTVGGTDAQM